MGKIRGGRLAAFPILLETACLEASGGGACTAHITPYPISRFLCPVILD